MTTCALSSAGAARGIFVCGEAAGAGTAIVWGGGGKLSDGAGDSSEIGLGVFFGFGVSLSFAAPFPFAVRFAFGDASFFRDFFLATFGFGVRLGDFFAFRETAVGSRVSLGFGFGVVSSFSPGLRAKVAL